MHASIGEPQAWLAQAESRNRVVPELGDRNTVEKSADDTPSTIDTQDRDHNPADDSHALGWENAEVLHQDGSFCAKNGGIVEWNGQPEGLVE